MDDLERHIEQSQTFLIFLSKGYFFSASSLRELDSALALKKPLILVVKPVKVERAKQPP